MLKWEPLRRKRSWPLPDAASVFDQGGQQDDPVRFRFTSPYETYPFLKVNSPSCSFFLEGCVYGHAASRITDALERSMADPNISATDLQRLTEDWTGEWCLWIQTGHVIHVVNDPLGRLPMYHHASEETFFIGRHLETLAREGALVHDKESAASYIWSGYMIGHRTPYKNVGRLPGRSVIRIDLQQATVDLTLGRPFCFDERDEAPLKDQAARLAELFRVSCKRIAGSWPHQMVISQSGGQDSRAVAVGFSEAVKDGRLSAASFTFSGSSAKDASLAAVISGQLGIPFKSYPIIARPEYEEELLRNKMGMNYVSMAFIHDFYKQLLNDKGNFMYITGDGGDKVFPYLGEKNPHLTLDELVVKLSRRHANLSVEATAALTGMAADDILHMIHETVSAYPEQRINDKSIHFTIYERAVQCFFEGEDRSRYFAWATTPFYDLDLFRMAMKVPDAYKKHYRIYRPFQNMLSKEVANIPDASGESINSWRFAFKKGLKEVLRSSPPALKNIMRVLSGTMISTNKGSAEEHEQLMDRLTTFEGLKSIFDAAAVKALLPNANTEQYDHLRTIILMESTLKEWRQR